MTHLTAELEQQMDIAVTLATLRFNLTREGATGEVLRLLIESLLPKFDDEWLESLLQMLQQETLKPSEGTAG